MPELRNMPSAHVMMPALKPSTERMRPNMLALEMRKAARKTRPIMKATAITANAERSIAVNRPVANAVAKIIWFSKALDSEWRLHETF